MAPGAAATALDPALAGALQAELGSAWRGECEAWRTLGSTNDRARELARGGVRAWSVVLAREQTAGRGRSGRRWESPAGNLYLSVLLPEVGARPGLVPLAAGVALAETLAGWGLSAELKWPNDVLVAGRKVAGILVEAASTGGRIQDVTVGIGVNLHSAPALPAGALQEATSVISAGGRPPELAPAAAAILLALARWQAALLADPLAVVSAWRQRAVRWWGEPVEVRAPGQVLRGRLVGLEPEGALVIETGDGARQRVDAGELLRLRRA